MRWEGAEAFGFDGAFLRKLERVALLNRRLVAGGSAGPRRSPHHGSSPEFADFRDYAEGDDLRRLDWNAFARLDRLFLRLYAAEEMGTVNFFIDRSRSMHAGKPEKAVAAARLAAALSYVALHAHDQVAVTSWTDRLDAYLPPQAGMQAIPRVWQFIARNLAESSARTDFAALRGHLGRRTGLAIVISDFLTDTDWRAGLLALRAAGHQVTVIQVLAPDELDPDFRGDWQLRDVENGRAVDVTISPRSLRRYHTELQAHLGAIRSLCRRHGMAYLMLPSDLSLEETLLRQLRAAGVVA